MIRKINNMKTFFLVVVLVFFSGCSIDEIKNKFSSDGKGSGFGDIGSSQELTEETGGVSLTIHGFDSKFYEGKEISPLLKFENYQKHKIDNIEVRFSGYDTGYVSNKRQDFVVNDLRASSNGNPGLSDLVFDRLTFTGLHTDYTANFNVNYCYLAESVLDAQVCIADVSKSSECGGLEESKNFGPILINIDKKITTQGNIKLTIRLEDRLIGLGVNNCFEDRDRVFENEYTIIEEKLGTSDLTCEVKQSEKTSIQKDSNKGFVECVVPRDSFPDSETTAQLRFKIESLYEQKKVHPFTVINIDDE